jgi:Domain of unknown function (DUF4157)
MQTAVASRPPAHAAPEDDRASRRAVHDDGRARGTRPSGVPLEPGLRRGLERGFGADLGDVRIHAGETAARSARTLGAAAYTVGNDVVFGAGRWAPHRPEGRRLLAHELTHVLQQRPAAGSGGLPDAEREADVASARVAAGLRTPRPQVRTGLAVARQDENKPPPAPVPEPAVPAPAPATAGAGDPGGGRLKLCPGEGPAALKDQKLPLPARLTNALGAGAGSTLVLDLDPRALVVGVLGRVDLNTSEVAGAPPGGKVDPEHQAKVQLVDPVARLDLGTGRIAGLATLHVPSSYPVNLHPGTDVPIRIDSTIKDPLTWKVGASYGPLTADATVRFHYDVGRLGASLECGASGVARELTHPGLTASGTGRLFGLPISTFGVDAPTTVPREKPLLGAPTPFPSTISAGGVIIAPAGSVTSIAAPAAGYYRSSFGESSGYSLTTALLPTLDPDAISAGAPFASRFPVHAFAEVSYVKRISDGLELGIRATAQVNTADLVNPPKGLPAPTPGSPTTPGALPAPGAPEPDPFSKDLPPLPTPIGPSAGITIFGRFK